MIEPIFYVETFLANNPAIRAKFRSRLIEAGHTGINDKEAWRIVENEFLKPYENSIYPKDYRDDWDSHGLPIVVGDDDVVSLIMSGTKVPGWW